MRYTIVIFTLACILVWDGWFNNGQWLDHTTRSFLQLLTYVGIR